MYNMRIREVSRDSAVVKQSAGETEGTFQIEN